MTGVLGWDKRCALADNSLRRSFGNPGAKVGNSRAWEQYVESASALGPTAQFACHGTSSASQRDDERVPGVVVDMRTQEFNGGRACRDWSCFLFPPALGASSSAQRCCDLAANIVLIAILLAQNNSSAARQEFLACWKTGGTRALRINDEYNWSLSYNQKLLRHPASPYSFRSNTKDQLCQTLSMVQVCLSVIAPPCKRYLSNKQGMACVVHGMPQVEPYNSNNKHVSRALEGNVVCDREIGRLRNFIQPFSILTVAVDFRERTSGFQCKIHERFIMALCCGSVVITLPEQVHHRGTGSMRLPADSFAAGRRVAFQARVKTAIATARWNPAQSEGVSTVLVKKLLIKRMLQCFDESEDPFHLHWFERSMTG
jgi:hypothetical protein